MAKFKLHAQSVFQVLVECPFDGHVAVTRWGNGEGFSLDMASEKGGVGVGGSLQVTWEQWEAIKRGVKALRKDVS